MSKKIKTKRLKITQNDIDVYKVSGAFMPIHNENTWVNYLMKGNCTDQKQLSPHKYVALMRAAKREIPLEENQMYVFSRKLIDDVDRYGVIYTGTYSVHIFENDNTSE